MTQPKEERTEERGDDDEAEEEEGDGEREVKGVVKGGRKHNMGVLTKRKCIGISHHKL